MVSVISDNPLEGSVVNRLMMQMNKKKQIKGNFNILNIKNITVVFIMSMKNKKKWTKVCDNL